MPFKFIYLCDLLEKLEEIELHDPPLFRSVKAKVHLDTVNQWFRSHRRIVDAATTDRAALLSTFLPERRTDRVYNLQEPGLVRVLARCLGFGRERLTTLTSWNPSNPVDLAAWVSLIQRQTDAALSHCNVTVEEVDAALARLAARSRYSGPRVREKSLTSARALPEDALRPLLHRLPSRELKWFIRLVLKKFGQVTLDEHLILHSVHALLPEVLKFQADFEVACELLRHPKVANFPTQPNAEYETMIHEVAAHCLNPKLGVKIGRPEFIKARSIKHCLQITGRGRWNIEPKYDGEYCQVHINLDDRENCIQIFSKSGKDSTQDKVKLHKWIRKCLQIGTPECKFKRRCILEGEMVLFSDKDQAILEFCKIRKHVPRSGTYLGTEADSQAHAHEHLEIVFFDALLIDEDVVMSQKYEVRRQRLKDISIKYAGRAQTGSWGTVDFSKLSPAKAIDKVERAFAKAIAQRCEGLILKPCDGPYFSLGKRKAGCHDGKVIKLKKDYIPGLGDTADFAIVGAGFVAADAQAWGEKNVRYTHFVLACLENKAEVLRYGVRPVLKSMTTLTRPCIPVPIIQQMSLFGKFQEELYDGASCKQPSCYDLRLTDADRPMTVTFKIPFIVEVMGAGFDKPSSQNFYMLRHSRILKIHQDRMWEDVVSFEDLQTMAKKAVSVPDDLLEEQREWLERLQKAGVPSKSHFLTTTSPFSDRATTATSSGSTRTSPVKTPRTAVAVPLIRIDSVELHPGEEQMYSGTTASASPTEDFQIKASLQVVTSKVFPLPDRLPRCQLLPMTGPEVPLKATKRKRPETEDVSTSETSSKRAVSEKHVNPIFESAARVRDEATAVSSPSVTPTFHTPLNEIKNGTSLRSSQSSSRPCDVGVDTTSALKPLSLSMFLPAAKNTQTLCTSDKPRRNTVSTLPSSNTQAKAALVTATIEPKSTTSKDPNRPPSIPEDRPRPPTSSAPTAETPFHTAPNTPAPQPSDVFRNHTFYLSPCIATFPLLTQDLLPLLTTHPTTPSLAHWRRDLLPVTAPPLGPLVGESQACPALQKAVLVEGRRVAPTELVVAALLGIALVRGERVEVWDWRVVEGVLGVADAGRAGAVGGGGGGGGGGVPGGDLDLDLDLELRIVLERWYLGFIAWDEGVGGNVYRTADRSAKVGVARGMLLGL